MTPLRYSCQHIQTKLGSTSPRNSTCGTHEDSVLLASVALDAGVDEISDVPVVVALTVELVESLGSVDAALSEGVVPSLVGEPVLVVPVLLSAPFTTLVESMLDDPDATADIVVLKGNAAVSVPVVSVVPTLAVTDPAIDEFAASVSVSVSAGSVAVSGSVLIADAVVSRGAAVTVLDDDPELSLSVGVGVAVGESVGPGATVELAAVGSSEFGDSELALSVAVGVAVGVGLFVNVGVGLAAVDSLEPELAGDEV